MLFLKISADALPFSPRLWLDGIRARLPCGQRMWAFASGNFGSQGRGFGKRWSCALSWLELEVKRVLLFLQNHKKWMKSIDIIGNLCVLKGWSWRGDKRRLVVQRVVQGTGMIIWLWGAKQLLFPFSNHYLNLLLKNHRVAASGWPMISYSLHKVRSTPWSRQKTGARLVAMKGPQPLETKAWRLLGAALRYFRPTSITKN